MSNVRVHGINLVGTIENLSIESLSTTPSYASEGLMWYDSVDNVIKGTVRNSENSLVVERLVDSQYLEDAVNLFEEKLPVTVATTTSMTVADCPDVIDGVTLSLDDRVLVKNATPTSGNGIYTVSALDGDGTVTLVRSEDADNSPDGGEVVSGIFTIVNNGTVNGGTTWLLRTPNPITLGTTGLTWEQISGIGDFSPGTGISKNGVVMSADLDGVTLIDVGGGVIGVDTSLLPTTILELTDVPNAFTNPGDVIRVNSSEDGFEFYDPKDTVSEFTDVPSTFGLAGTYLAVNSAGDAFEYVNPTTDIQAELDATELGIGLNADGTYTSPVGNYMSGATVISNILDLSSALTGLYTNCNASVYTEATTTPATQHVINHGLGTTDIFVTLWVYNTSDSSYHLDVADFVLTDANNITVNLGTAENIKVIVRSAENITV